MFGAPRPCRTLGAEGTGSRTTVLRRGSLGAGGLAGGSGCSLAGCDFSPSGQASAGWRRGLCTAFDHKQMHNLGHGPAWTPQDPLQALDALALPGAGQAGIRQGERRWWWWDDRLFPVWYRVPNGQSA